MTQRSLAAFPRYPYGLVPRGRRRGRHHGIFWYVWLGSHPVLLLISAVISLYIFATVLAWIALVTLAWLAWGSVRYVVLLPMRWLPAEQLIER